MKSKEFYEDWEYEILYDGGSTIYNPKVASDWCKCELCDDRGKPISAKTVQYGEAERLKDLRWDFYDLSDELVELMISKNEDYGSKNILNTPGGPLNGLAVRLYDKIERLSNLTTKNATPNHESIRDTLIDIANYAIIGVLVEDDKWK
jgi:hypothetical protein